MTREEKISKAAYSQYCNSESVCFNLMCDSFKQGAKWADENPKSPWISVKEDLPCKHEKLIYSNNKNLTLFVIALVHSFAVLSRMEQLDGNWHWTTDEPSYWFPIPEPPKE